MKLSDRLAAEQKEAAKEKKKMAQKKKTSATSKPGAESELKSGGRLSGRSASFEELEDLKATLRSRVVKDIGPRLRKGTIDDAALKGRISALLEDLLHSSKITIGPRERADFIGIVMSDMMGWGPLEPLMADPEITEIMCNAFDDVWIERDGLIERSDVSFPNPTSYRQVIDRMLSAVGRRVDESSPMADGRLMDGSRINAILPPLAPRAPILTVRRFRAVPFTVTDLIAQESLTNDAALFLEAAVRAEMNTVVSGGSGTGKTTLLNVVSSFIPESDRVITIEDAAELRLNQPHVLTLESRPPNIEGAGQVTIRDLVRNALRMRPDRIIVGEVRGGEALDMLQAMNTGHEGSLTTVHANTPRDALSRIETMTLMAGTEIPHRAIREQIASALHLIIHLERTPEGRRVVSSITEIQGREGDTITMQEIFKRQGGQLKATGLRPKVAERMAERGATVPAKVFRGKSSQPVRRKRSR